MIRFSKMIIFLSAILLSIISYYFFAGWFNIIPWTTFALLTGYFSVGRENIILNGAVFGYFLFLSYIIIGYKGNWDKAGILKFILFSLAFSLVGAVAGIVGAFIGNFLKNKLAKKNNK